MAARLRELRAGADRQRGGEPAPARRVRRGHRRALARPGHRRHGRPARLGAAARPAHLPGEALGRAGRGNLGGPRAAAALRPLQGDGLGGLRPRGPGGAGGHERPGRAVAGHPGPDSRRGLREGVRREARRVHAVLRLVPARRGGAADPGGGVPAAGRPPGRVHGPGRAARAGDRRAGPPVPAGGGGPGAAEPGRPARQRGRVPGLQLLAGERAAHDRPGRRGHGAVRAAADPAQRPGAAQRGIRPPLRTAGGQHPAGLQPRAADPGRAEPGPARRRAHAGRRTGMRRPFSGTANGDRGSPPRRRPGGLPRPGRRFPWPGAAGTAPAHPGRQRAEGPPAGVHYRCPCSASTCWPGR